MAQLAQSLDGWPTIEEAAAQLQTSVRTIWRHAEAGRVEMQKRPRPGKKPENLCNPDDIQKLQSKPHVMPDKEEQNGSELFAPVNQEKLTFAYLLRELLQRTQPAQIPAPSPLPWITVEEASAATGLAPGFIRRQIREEKIDAVRGGPRGKLRIRRTSLDEFSGSGRP